MPHLVHVERSSSRRILIVGGGLAGLACARAVADRGHTPVVFESSDRIGGRCTSDVVDGFTLDRGFQVYLTRYSEGVRLLRDDAMRWRRFWPGARICDGTRVRTVAHPLRDPLGAIASVLSGALSLNDLRSLVPLARIMAGAQEDHAGVDGISSRAWLRARGVNDRVIDRFFRPFLGGVFLDRSLDTDAGRMRFYMSCFGQGNTVVPAAGMKAIPEAIAAPLPSETLRLLTPVVAVTRNAVTLANGSVERGDAVVVATDMTNTARYFPDFRPPPWRSTVTIWFATDAGDATDQRLHLNGSSRGLVNHAVAMSAVAPEYAPSGAGLWCANIVGGADGAVTDVRRGIASQRELVMEVQRELDGWLGRGRTAAWQAIRVDRIDRAIPRQHPSDLAAARPVEIDGVHLAGDHVADASINGALRSGRIAAERAIASVQ